MTYDEIIAAERVPASDPGPGPVEDSGLQFFAESADEPSGQVRWERFPAEGFWRGSLKTSSGTVTARMPGRNHGRVTQADLTSTVDPDPSEGFRPPWLPGEFLPRMAPRETHLPPVPRRGPTDAPALPLRFIQQPNRAWPWCTVGRVFYGHGTNLAHNNAGTGVLVGRDLLLTASHLAPWGERPGNWWMHFVPAYSNGTPYLMGSSYVRSFYGVRNEGDGDVTGLDYVICKLYEPLGDQCGWMGTQSWGNTDAYYSYDWISVGYPETFFVGELPAVQFAIGIKDIDGDGDGLELETVDFTAHGWSGGPLWNRINGDPKVVGVLSGREKDGLDPRRSVFAGGHHMVSLVKLAPALV